MIGEDVSEQLDVIPAVLRRRRLRRRDTAAVPARALWCRPRRYRASLHALILFATEQTGRKPCAETTEDPERTRPSSRDTGGKLYSVFLIGRSHNPP
jgi:hypothetical protein